MATGYQAARAGQLPERLWTELYFQTAHDPSVAPEGVHTMSVFAQYVPHTFAGGDWDSRRDDVKDLAIGSIARYCDNIPGAVLDVQVLGPPDIEREVGLTGGHIFQGECLPEYMWDKRLRPAHADARRLPLRGLHLPRRQRDRHQRPQRRDGSSGRGISSSAVAAEANVSVLSPRPPAPTSVAWFAAGSACPGLPGCP